MSLSDRFRDWLLQPIDRSRAGEPHKGAPAEPPIPVLTERAYIPASSWRIEWTRPEKYVGAVREVGGMAYITPRKLSDRMLCSHHPANLQVPVLSENALHAVHVLVNPLDVAHDVPTGAVNPIE